jgi:hypothetical protein
MPQWWCARGTGCRRGGAQAPASLTASAVVHRVGGRISRRRFGGENKSQQLKLSTCFMCMIFFYKDVMKFSRDFLHNCKYLGYQLK